MRACGVGARVYIYARVCVWVRVLSCVFTFLRACVCVRVYVWGGVRACVFACLLACVLEYVRLWMGVRASVSECVCVRGCASVFVRSSVPCVRVSSWRV